MTECQKGRRGAYKGGMGAGAYLWCEGESGDIKGKWGRCLYWQRIKEEKASSLLIIPGKKRSNGRSAGTEL